MTLADLSLANIQYLPPATRCVVCELPIQVIGGTNYLLELKPSIERVLYVGLASGVAGLAFFASPLGGALVDWLGFEALFLAALGCALLAVGISLRLEEPRRRLAIPVSPA